MAPQEPLARSLAALSRLFVGDGTLQVTLDRVATAPRGRARGGHDRVTMLVDGRAKTAVFTDEAAPETDSAQYETGIGPCLDSFRSIWPNPKNRRGGERCKVIEHMSRDTWTSTSR